jgi:hypothetical protein
LSLKLNHFFQGPRGSYPRSRQFESVHRHHLLASAVALSCSYTIMEDSIPQLAVSGASN